MSTSTITPTNLSIGNLDFANLRASLKAFLQSQSAFTDYNFDGSGMAVILDLLAYNAYFDAFVANATVNETYLSTAKRRDSVVKLAKMLGYMPQSVKPASASINICCVIPNSFVGTPPASLSLPLNFELTATGTDGVSYTFYVTENHTLGLDATIGSQGAYTNFANTDTTLNGAIEIREGTLKTFTYVYDATLSSDPILLPDQGIDSLSIVVTELTNSNQQYTLADDINVVDENSKVFWMEEMTNQQYRIYFGDGVLGSPPAQNAVISVAYRVTNGASANGIGQQNILAFAAGVGTLANQPAGSTLVPTVVVTNGVITGYSSGGSGIESVESVKFNAPKNFQAQNRMVTAGDYERVIQNSSPFTIESISVYGGQTLNPPQLGKVFISIKPAGADFMNSTQQADVEEIIANKAVLGIDPVFVDPSYLYIQPSVTVYYDATVLTGTEAALNSMITTAITNYSDNDLQRFGKIFKYSNLLTNIQEADPSVTRALLNVSMYMKQSFGTSLNNNSVSYTSAAILTMNFGNPLYHPDNSYKSVWSSSFTYAGNTNCQLMDNGAGTLTILHGLTVLDGNIGTVDYVNGVIVLGRSGHLFLPDDSSVTVNIYAVPTNDGAADIYTQNEQILEIESSEITVAITKEQFS